MLIENHAVNLLKKVIKKDGFLELPAQGNSMFPFIRQGNSCRFAPCPALKRGDVILFYSAEGSLIAHRIVHIQMRTQQPIYFIKGDTNLSYDQPIKEEHILGKLVSIQKQHFQITTDNVLAKVWGKMILAFPFLSGMLQRYLKLFAKTNVNIGVSYNEETD